MNTIVLRSFLEVARQNGFSAAARTLHMTQPTISMQISRLEESLGLRLFDRRGRKASLTPAGRHLFGRVEDLLRAAGDLESAAADFRGLKAGVLDIGTTDVASIYVLPRAYRRFLNAYPEVNLSVAIDGSTPLIQALREGRVELVVCSLPVDGEELDVTVIDRDRLLIILPRRHPLAERKRIRIETLCDTPMITFKANSVTRREVDHVFASRSLSPAVAMEISSPEAIKKLVEVGLGFAVLPERSVRAEIRDGRLASPSLIGTSLERKIGVIKMKGHYLSPAAQAFLEILDKIRPQEDP